MSVMSTIAGGINAAGTITNILTDATPKSFYNLRDFYNFIRKDENCPMEHKNFFTIVPEIKVTGLESLIGSGNGFWEKTGNTFKNIGEKLWNNISGKNASKDSKPENFEFSEYNLARFALAAQSITVPPFILKGSTQSINTPYGRSMVMPGNDQQALGAESNIITMTFLEMSNPIIEHFIIPWMISMQKQNVDSISYKLNIVIKFYRADEIAGLDFLMNPTYIYRINGLFPTNATLTQPAHGASSSLSSRAVTFAFNNLMVFSNAQWEKFITGQKEYFAYDDLSPIQILNKLNYQAANVATAYNQVKSLF